MRAWQVEAWGEPEQMKLREIATPEPGPNQVRIRNRAAALNFFDILQVQGKYQIKPPFPFTPGAEVAGVVDAVGSGVTQFTAGDPVLALVHGGGLAEYSLAEAGRTFRLTGGLGFPEAAAMPIVYHTTYYALVRRTQIRKGEWLLVHAGASGVGTAAIQFGRAQGARVIATAGSQEKLDFCHAQGAEHVFNYSDETWPDQVRQVTGGCGADIVYDPVGGDVLDLSTRCIAPEGRLLIIGFASGRIPEIAANRILLKNVSVVGIFWGSYVQSHPEFIAETQQALEKMYAAGQIRPVVSRCYRLAEAPRAMRDLAQRKVMGKAVLIME